MRRVCNYCSREEPVVPFDPTCQAEGHVYCDFAELEPPAYRPKPLRDDPQLTEVMTVQLGDGWTGRGTEKTRVAFHVNGSTIVFQKATLIAEAQGVTARVLSFLFGAVIDEAK